MDRLF